MIKIKIRASLGEGWSAFMRRPWYLMGIALAFGALFVVSVGNAVITALAGVLYCGYIMLLMRHFRGEYVEFDDLFSIDTRWISYAFLMLIKTFLIMLGFLCFIIPGIYLSIRWIFAEMLVIDQGMRPLEALRASSKMTAGNRWRLFGLTFVGVLMIIVGIFFLFIGALVAGTVLTFALIKVYDELKLVLTQVQTEVFDIPSSENSEEAVA